MKTNTVLLAAIFTILFSQNTYAQGISAGIRTGIGNSFDVTKLRSTENTPTWDKEVFARYETKGRFAFELGANHYSYSETVRPYYEWCLTEYFPSGNEIIAAKNQYNIINIGASVQYDVSCKALQEKCPLFKRMRNYIGVNAGTQYGNVNTTSTNRRYSDGNITESKNSISYFNHINIGLSHTLTYTFNKLYFTSVAGLNTNTQEAFSNFAPIPSSRNSSLSLRLGFGYKL